MIILEQFLGEISCIGNSVLQYAFVWAVLLIVSKMTRICIQFKTESVFMNSSSETGTFRIKRVIFKLDLAIRRG